MRLYSNDSPAMTTTADGSPPSSGRDAEILRTMTRVVAARARIAVELGLSLEQEALKTGVRLACESARRQGLQAENLVMMVRTSWRSFAESLARERPEYDAALDQLITMCIVEFYRVPERSLKPRVTAHADGPDGRRPALARRRDGTNGDERR